MVPSDQVLWTLDNGIQPFDFERLCVDLLSRYGFRHIVPIGGVQDQGRDAELRYWRGEADGDLLVVFQFSLQKVWESKLRKDAKKIANNSQRASRLVFVTSQDVTGAKRDQLRREFRATYDWDLSLYSREWFRHKLTQFDQDLAKEYLGLDLPPTIGQATTQIDLAVMDDENFKDIFAHSSPEFARASIIETTRQEPDVASNWYRLARIDFLLRNYPSSLEAVTAALQKKDPRDRLSEINMTNFKGAILAEMGIQGNSRPLLIQAKDIFVYAASKIKRAQDYYNLANVWDALGEFDKAEEAYLRCLELKPDYPQAWKNIGSLYSKKEQTEKALECFQKALHHNPNLVEGHLSLATTYLLFCESPLRAVECFEKAFTLAPEADRKWKYVRYWYSKALYLLERDEEALIQLEKELVIRPDDVYLLNHKAQVLSHLRNKDKKFENQALTFLQFRAEAIPEDFAGLNELIEIYSHRRTPEAAWPWIDANLRSSSVSLSELATRAELSTVQLRSGFLNFKQYRNYRRRYPLSQYFDDLQEKGLSSNRDIIPVLNHALMAPFGIIGEGLNGQSHRPGEAIKDVFEPALVLIAKIIPSAGSPLLHSTRPNTKDGQIELISRGMVLIPEIVILELSRQIGFIAGTFGISNDRIPATPEVDWNEIMMDVSTHLMAQALTDWETLVK